MERIDVEQQGVSYPVFIGAELLAELGSIIDGAAPGLRPVIVTSPTVDRFHGDAIRAALGPDTPQLLIDDGEEQKTLDSVSGLIDRFLELGLKRDSVAVILGGGVVGDAAGFAASIYLRGIAFVHVPTTLLAQVDSSIGGKLGVNHRAGKNLIGSFAWPRAVVSDVTLLGTLPARELRSGLFEALKSGVIGDRQLFELIEKRGRSERWETERLLEIVRRSARVKAGVVSSDPREAGERMLLNYGHTLGHAIEAVTHYRTITHGDAVGWGMIAANRIAVLRGMLSADEAARIDSAIIDLEPESPGALLPAALIAASGFDKKFSMSRKVMILPVGIGSCRIVDDISGEEIEAGIEAMFDAWSRSQTRGRL
jgi:3-dehydroquinate synthase